MFAVVLKMPGKEELVNGSPMTGKAGRYWEREFLWPLGIKRADLIICNALRCYPNGGEFPTGKVKVEALAHCRHWDRLVEEWKPNVWGVSFNPAALMRNPQQTKFLIRSLKRARDLAREGRRVCLLLG